MKPAFETQANPFAQPPHHQTMFKPLQNPVVDMRLAACGQAQPPGWQVAWAQVIGCRHPHTTEDALGHRLVVLPGNEANGPGPGNAAVNGLNLAGADGVGGGARGDIASAALVAHCLAVPPELQASPDSLLNWMAQAEAQVQAKLREVTEAPGAATLAAAWLHMPQASSTAPLAPSAPSSSAEPGLVEGEKPPEIATFAQGFVMRIGDARAYMFDPKPADGEAGQQPEIRQLTQDQSFAHVGEPPPPGGSMDDPARMVGTGFVGELELLPICLQANQLLLLCSDGLHRGLSNAQMADAIAKAPSLETAALKMVQMARIAGSDDDISVLIAGLALAPNSSQKAEAQTSAKTPRNRLNAFLGRLFT